MAYNILHWRLRIFLEILWDFSLAKLVLASYVIIIGFVVVIIIILIVIYDKDIIIV